MIACVEGIIGESAFWVRVLQSMFGSISVVLIFLITDRLASRLAAISAGILAAVFSPFIYYDNMLLLESSQILLVILHLLWLLLALEKRKRAYWLLSGAALGCLIVFRSTHLLYALALLVYLFWNARRNKQIALRRELIPCILVMLVTILPWTITNYQRENIFVPITSSSGFNFYAGNNDRAGGEYTMLTEVDILRDMNGHRFVERRIGRSMNSSEVSSYWFDQAFAWISVHPGDFLSLFLKKILLFWNQAELDQLGLSPAFIQQEYSTLLRLPLPNFFLITLLASAGIAFAYSEKRTRTFQRITLMFVFASMLSTALFFISSRFRLPIAPVLLIYSGIAIHEVVNAMRKKAWKKIGTALIASLAMGLFMTTLNISISPSFSEEYNRLGLLAFDSRDYSIAEKNFIQALDKKDNPRIRLNLANTYAAMHRLKEADSEYEAVIRSDPQNAIAYFNFGNFALQVNQPKQAYELWKKALRLDSTLAPAYRNIAVLYSQAGQLEVSKTYFEWYTRYESDPLQRSNALRDIENLRRLLEQERTSKNE